MNNRSLIVANWKANPATAKEAVALARSIERGISKYRNIEVVIAPPLLFLEAVGKVIKKLKLGAQDIFWDEGPYTGEVSWRELKEAGVKYVIVGHSERKIHLGETDEMINKKTRAALEGGLTCVLCVGEQERVGNEISEILGEQLKHALDGVKKAYLKNLTVAYEPIWAISTTPGARANTPDNMFRAIVYIKKILTTLYGRRAADSVRVIYGGSVSADNIGPFLREGKAEGALVGRASLDPKEFIKLVGEASKTAR